MFFTFVMNRRAFVCDGKALYCFTLRFSSHGIQSAGKKKREIEKHSGRVDQQQWIDYYFWKRCAAKTLLLRIRAPLRRTSQ